ncbi:MAG: nitroreductase family protein [Bacteroidales bacterium]
MIVEQLIRQNRSYRRFYQDYYIATGNLKYFINLARLSPSSKNLQPLKYYISNEKKTNNKIFKCLKWAGYLPDWEKPKEGERPAAYIIILADKDIRNQISCDHGIAAQSILLGAVEKGFGGCIIASIDRERLRQEISIPENLDILLTLALGKPKETVMVEEVGQDGDIKYWRDENKIHHVPKRKLEDIIINSSKT